VGDVASALGINADDLVAPINEQLRQQGKPAITAEQIQATIRGVARRGVRQGELDHEVLVEELARHTALSRADAADIAEQFSDRFDQISERVSRRAVEVGERAKTAALTAADRTGKALLVGGIMMLIALAAAIAGGVLGVRNQVRDPREQVRATTPPPTVS
jgi:hypothetical protein